MAVPESYHGHEVLKIDSLKFFSCPTSFITARSWELLELVNETTDLETGTILHLPFPGSLTQQPEWYREAVKIKKAERLSEWYAEKLEQRMKDRADRGR